MLYNMTVKFDNISNDDWMDKDPYGADVLQFYLILNGLSGSMICCFGIIGNIFSIVIFSRMSRAFSSSTNIILLAIAVTDLMVLSLYILYDFVCIVLPPSPIIDFHHIQKKHVGTFMYFLYYTWLYPANMFITASNWCTVSVMVFRFIAIYFPLKACQWCTPTRAKIVLVIITILSILSVIPDCFTIHLIPINGYGFYITDTELARDRTFENVYQITFLETVNSPLPFTICFVLSGLLIRTLQQRQQSLGMESTGGSKRQRNQRRISIMLIAIVISFIICTIPAYVWRGMKHGVRSGRIKQGTWVMMRGVADIFLIINHSAKFLIYIFTNIMFRKSFSSLLFCRASAEISGNSLQVGLHSRYSEKREASTKLSNKSVKPTYDQSEAGADKKLLSSEADEVETVYQSTNLGPSKSVVNELKTNNNDSTDSSSLSGSDGTLQNSACRQREDASQSRTTFVV